MAVGSRSFVLALTGIALSACQSSLPVPDYVAVKTPPPFRSGPNGTLIDNEDQLMGARGYRVDQNGNRIGEVDVQAKMGNQTSSAMAGFYNSTTGSYVPGKVMAPSEGARSGAGYGPGSANMPYVDPATVTPTPTVTVPATPPASSAPVPLAPQTK
ncbi:MAG TPA: hypothetical protein VFB13_20650 [Reyranella sp.]|nr:hypothetical protein [Reyranella sp.]